MTPPDGFGAVASARYFAHEPETPQGVHRRARLGLAARRAGDRRRRLERVGPSDLRTAQRPLRQTPLAPHASVPRPTVELAQRSGRATTSLRGREPHWVNRDGAGRAL